MSNDLASRMQRLSYSPGGRAQCKVATLLANLSTSDEDAQVRECINNPAITATAFASVMKSEGHDISAFSVRRHRRGECACS